MVNYDNCGDGICLVCDRKMGKEKRCKIKTSRKLIHCFNILCNCRVISNSALNDTKLVVEFTLHHQVNNLSKLQPLKKRQIAIHKLISYMKYEKRMSWRRISSWLNRSGIKTHRGNTWSETGSSVHSVIKRYGQREERIEKLRHKKYKSKLSKMKMGFILLDFQPLGEVNSMNYVLNI